jgi:hypothetical protein
VIRAECTSDYIARVTSMAIDRVYLKSNFELILNDFIDSFDLKSSMN